MKRFYFLLILLPVFITSVEIENKASIPLLSPSYADRQTAKLKLKNGLQAYIISDPRLKQSGAVLTIDVGSWNEPATADGFAHFLEHMLFLGTEKYPGESDYSRYIQENSGVTNGYTINDRQSYMFTINNEAFAEALDRFSQFFITPLFNPSGVQREMHAVDQEYRKFLASDPMRELYVRKALARKEHPHHRFHIGNIDTLQNVTTEQLKKWFEIYYTPERMHLVVESTLPLDELKGLVDTHFSEIPKRPFPKEMGASPITDPAYQGRMILIEPIKDTRTLSLLWEVPPSLTENPAIRPDRLVAYVIGYEGEGSLLAQLKKEELADSITVDTVRTGKDNQEFVIEIGLTKQGLKKVESVIERVFQTINFLHTEGIPKKLFEEIRSLQTLLYQYGEKDALFDTLFAHSFQITEESLETYPEMQKIVHTYDQGALIRFLDVLTPKNATLFLTAKNPGIGKGFDKSEPYLNVPYGIVSLSREKLKQWEEAKPHPALSLPPPNSFIPRHLEVLQPSNGKHLTIPHPRKIIDEPTGVVYYAQDRQFGMPIVYLSFLYKTPYINAANSSSLVLGDLMAKLLKEKMVPYAYPAKQAGLSCKIEREDHGIQFTIKGYSEKSAELIKELISTLSGLNPSLEEFRLAKEALLREYQNLSVDTPLAQTSDFLKSGLYSAYATDSEKATAILKISHEKFLEFQKKVFSELFLEAMLYGNLSKEQALKVGQYLLKSFAAEPYSNPPEEKILIVPKPFILLKKIEARGNGAILLVEDPIFSYSRKAAQQIFMQSISEPFFNALRTKQQTGYIVISYPDEKEEVLLNIFAVQSSTHGGRDLIARFELFLEKQVQNLPSKEHFLKIKEAALINLRQPPQSLDAMGELLTTLMLDYKSDFSRVQKRIEAMEQLDYETFVSYAAEIYGRSNKHRIAFIGEGSQDNPLMFDYETVKSIQKLKKLSSYD